MMLKWLCWPLAAAAIMLVGGCIDGHEEYWLEADGGGRAEIRYEVPASLLDQIGGADGLRAGVDKFVRETPTLSDVTREITVREDRAEILLHARFSSIADLVAATGPDEADNTPPSAGERALDALVGRFDLTRNGRQVDFSRKVRPGDMLGPLASILGGSSWDGRGLVYVLHLPMPPESHNATRVTDGGRTLEWRCPLDGGPPAEFGMRFRATAPLPWRWMAAGGIGLLALSAAGWKFAGRRRPAGIT